MKKKGRSLPEVTVNKVKNFYSSDEISRVMPGIKDCVTIRENETRRQIQKKLLLHSSRDIYNLFKDKFPEAKLSFSKFKKLRPPECILAGKSGTHNVCVCKIHQNFKFKVFAIKETLNKKNVDFTNTYHDFVKSFVCKDSNPSCFLLKCKECPGIAHASEKLKSLFKKNKISELKFSQWTTTDR